MILVLGFIRRDYGAAGLFELTQSSLLDGVQIIILSVVLTLFLPCLAQLMILAKEQGIFFSLLIVVITLLVSWGTGFFLGQFLNFISSYGLNLI